MGKDGWTTIGIPDELYEQISELVPEKGKSVSEYVRFWVGIGIRFDKVGAGNPELTAIMQDLVKRLAEAP